MPLGIEHNISGLKIAIKKALTLLCRQVFGKHTEVCLEFKFVEIEFRSFQKAILKVIKVEKHAVFVKFRLRIAVRPVESVGAAYLNVRQFSYGIDEQLLLMLVISATCIAPATYGRKQRNVAEVGLKIAQLVGAYRQHFGHRYPIRGEVIG